MINRFLALVITLQLSILPAAAASVGMTAPKSSGARVNGVAPAGSVSNPSLSLAAPALGLTPALTLPAPALPPLQRLEAATPASIAALAADRTPASAFAAAVAAQPALLQDAGVRAQAVTVLGTEGLARLESAVAALDEKAGSDAALAAALSDFRRASPAVSPVKAQVILGLMAAAFGVMKGDAGSAPADGPAVMAAKQPVRRAGTLKRWTLAALTALAVAQPIAATAQPQESLAQRAAHVLIAPTPAVLGELLAQAGAQQAAYARFRTADELVRNWNPNQHVYVNGNVGIDDAALRRLEASLAGTHWTVVLVEDSQGFRYNGKYDDAAIDYATGSGIPSRGDFAAQTNAQTGESDGSVLTIVLNQHVLLLHNSDAQKNRGLDGETRFASRDRNNPDALDRWAIAALRSGTNVQAAVTNTVSNIDQLLAQAIANEAQTAAQTVADARAVIAQYESARAAFAAAHPNAAVGRADVNAARRAVTQAEGLIARHQGRAASAALAASVSDLRSAIDQMRGFDSAFAAAGTRLDAAKAEVDRADAASAAFRRDHRDAGGDLAQPGVRAWRDQVEAATRLRATDPAAAQRAADAVTAQARAVAEAIAQFPSGAHQLADAQSFQRQQSGRDRASSAQAQLTQADQALRAVDEALRNGDSSWTRQLAAAKAAQAEAQRVIDAADASARAAAVAFWTVLSLVTLGLGLLGFFLNLRSRRARRKAKDALAKWDAILEKKLEAIYGGTKPGDALNNLEAKIDTYAGPVSGQGTRGWVDDTATLAASLRSDAGHAKLLLAKARKVHDAATALVNPAAWVSLGWWRNQVWPSGYAKAERMLDKDPIEITPDDGLTKTASSDWREDLYGTGEDVYKRLKPFTNFEALMTEFNASAKAAVDAVEKLEKAVTQSGAIFDGYDAGIARAAGLKSKVSGAADGLFSVAAVFETALPAATELVKKSRETAVHNPIKGVYGSGAEAGRIVKDAEALVDAVVAARAGSLASADAAAKLIEANEVDAAWIGKEKKALSALADKIAADAAAAAVGERVAALTGKLDDLKARAEDIAAGTKALAELRRAMDGTEAAIGAARVKIGTALSVDSENILVEAGSNPAEFLAKGRELAEQTDQLLGQGKLAEAKGVFAGAEQQANGAAAIVAAGLKSLETHAATEQARKAETERLEGLVPARQRVLASIEADFAESVLALSAGDASHPNSNGTVKDNVDEANAAIEAATSKREKALRAFRDGKVISAADLLSQVAAHQAIAQHRLDEIAEKRARLDKAVADNKAQRLSLEATAKEYVAKVAGDARTMQPTLKAFKAAQQTLAQGAELVDQAKGDPFKAGAALAAAAAALAQVWVSARNDFDQYAEVERSLQAAYRQLQSAGELAGRAKNDGTADSPAITSAYRELASLEDAYRRSVEAAKAAHGDWKALDIEADRITNEASHVAATLSGELAAAASATSAVSSAASKVREASNWSGSHGVYIPGSPGSGSLDAARAALARGDYQGAISNAESARRAAASAISQAEAQVAAAIAEERRRREEEERARRRRQEEEEERRRSSSSGGSSWGSSSSGNGGSSWGGSSSGNGKSGW